MFANFLGVNIPTMADIKLSKISLRRKEEMHITGFPSCTIVSRTPQNQVLRSECGGVSVSLLKRLNFVLHLIGIVEI